MIGERIRQSYHSERGQSLVEAAIMVPLLILLVATVVDVARIYHTYMVLTNATREGARYYSRMPCTSDNVSDLNDDILKIVHGETADLVTPVDDSDITIEAKDPIEANGCPTNNSEVRVSIAYQRFQTWLGTLTPAGSWTLRAGTTMLYTGNNNFVP
jgi:Flp pilus assembly protein TadG